MRLPLILLLIVAGCSDDTAAPGAFWETAEANEVALPSQEPSQPDPDPPPVVSADAHAESLVGLWMVDQPYHALYEVTWYSFGPDGELAEVASETYGHEVPTGTVGRCLTWSPQDEGHCADFTNTGECAEYDDPYCTAWSDVSCTFADRWSGTVADLSIRATCSDGTIRTVVLDLREVVAGVADAPVVRSVDGEQDWHHNAWDWRWLKCPSNDIDDCRGF